MAYSVCVCSIADFGPQSEPGFAPTFCDAGNIHHNYVDLYLHMMAKDVEDAVCQQEPADDGDGTTASAAGHHRAT